MLNYQTKAEQSFFIDFVTVPAANIVNGANTFTFNDPTTSLYAYYLSLKYRCVPWQFVIYNTTDLLYTFAQFTDQSKFWCNKINFEVGEYTVAYCIDGNKGNHTHVVNIGAPIELNFNSPGVPGGGGLNIWIMFSAWPNTKYNLI
jgi:hypothetical protein